MTDRGTPTPADAISTGLSAQEREDQDRLNQGIESLLEELVISALPPHLMEAFHENQPLQRKTQDELGIINTALSSYRSPLTDKNVRTLLTYSFQSSGFNASGFAEYGDGTPPESLSSTGFSSVNTLGDLETVRASLLEKGLLPSETQGSDADSPAIARQVWINPRGGYWLDEALEPLLPPQEIPR